MKTVKVRHLPKLGYLVRKDGYKHLKGWWREYYLSLAPSTREKLKKGYYNTVDYDKINSKR